MKRITGFFSWLFGTVKGHEFAIKGITTILLAAGAVRLPDGTMLDPQGNEFSAAQPGRPAG